MNKKILLPLLALAILPVLAFGLGQDDADKIGKQYAADNPGLMITTHTLEAAITEAEEVDRAELIIEGTIKKVTPHWKVIRNDADPVIYTEFTLKVTDVIKGNVQGNNVKFVMSGGQLDGVTSFTEGSKLAKGDKVILLLAKDSSSIFGDNYSTISVSKSIYVFDEDYAKNKHDDRSDHKDKVKERISDLDRENRQ